MNTPTIGPTNARPTPTFPSRLQNASDQVDYGAGPQSGSWFLRYLPGIIAFCWAALRPILVKKFLSGVLSWAQSTGMANIIWHRVQRWVEAYPQREQELTRLIADETPHDLVNGGQPSPAQTTSPKKVSWSYLRGVSLALSELCQDGNYGGDRIPLSAVLDLMRQHQSAFVPLGPHVERDVPRRLIQLANEGVVFFDPFKEYVVVPEATRQRYALRRQELLAKGVDPANLSVFGAAFTRGLRQGERVTRAAVASYKGQFLLIQAQMRNRAGATLTRGESLISIADAICPPRLMPEIEEPEGSTRVDGIRRGHSIVTDLARMISGSPHPDSSSQEGTAHGSKLRRGPSILPEMSAIIRERDALEAQKDRLRTVLETSD